MNQTKRIHIFVGLFAIVAVAGGVVWFTASKPSQPSDLAASSPAVAPTPTVQTVSCSPVTDQLPGVLITGQGKGPTLGAARDNAVLNAYGKSEFTKAYTDAVAKAEEALTCGSKFRELGCGQKSKATCDPLTPAEFGATCKKQDGSTKDDYRVNCFPKWKCKKTCTAGVCPFKYKEEKWPAPTAPTDDQIMKFQDFCTKWAADENNRPPKDSCNNPIPQPDEEPKCLSGGYKVDENIDVDPKDKKNYGYCLSYLMCELNPVWANENEAGGAAGGGGGGPGLGGGGGAGGGTGGEGTGDSGMGEESLPDMGEGMGE